MSGPLARLLGAGRDNQPSQSYQRGNDNQLSTCGPRGCSPASRVQSSVVGAVPPVNLQNNTSIAGSPTTATPNAITSSFTPVNPGATTIATTPTQDTAGVVKLGEGIHAQIKDGKILATISLTSEQATGKVEYGYQGNAASGNRRAKADSNLSNLVKSEVGGLTVEKGKFNNGGMFVNVYAANDLDTVTLKFTDAEGKTRDVNISRAQILAAANAASSGSTADVTKVSSPPVSATPSTDPVPADGTSTPTDSTPSATVSSLGTTNSDTTPSATTSTATQASTEVTAWRDKNEETLMGSGYKKVDGKLQKELPAAEIQNNEVKRTRTLDLSTKKATETIVFKSNPDSEVTYLLNDNLVIHSLLGKRPTEQALSRDAKELARVTAIASGLLGNYPAVYQFEKPLGVLLEKYSSLAERGALVEAMGPEKLGLNLHETTKFGVQVFDMIASPLEPEKLSSLKTSVETLLVEHLKSPGARVKDTIASAYSAIDSLGTDAKPLVNAYWTMILNDKTYTPDWISTPPTFDDVRKTLSPDKESKGKTLESQ